MRLFVQDRWAVIAEARQQSRGHIYMEIPTRYFWEQNNAGATSKQTANVETRFNRRTEERIMSQNLSVVIQVIMFYKCSSHRMDDWQIIDAIDSSHINLEIQLWSLHRHTYYCIKNSRRKDIIAAYLAYRSNESESDFINVKRDFINTNTRIIYILLIAFKCSSLPFMRDWNACSTRQFRAIVFSYNNSRCFIPSRHCLRKPNESAESGARGRNNGGNDRVVRP